MRLIREFDEFDWIRNIPLYVTSENPPKKGDVLICLPGFIAQGDNSVDRYGGLGYVEGKVIVVYDITKLSPPLPGKEFVVWPDIVKSGKYGKSSTSTRGEGIWNGALAYYTGDIITESDGMDWIRDIPSTVLFDDVKVGETYRVVLTDNFKRAVKNCGSSGNMLRADIVVVEETTNTNSSGVYCENDGSATDTEKAHFLRFYQGSVKLGYFYVVGGMVDFYPMEGTTINESDGLDWIRDVKESPKLKDYLQHVVDGDELVLRGEIVHGETYQKSWVNDFEVTINNVGGKSVSHTTFSIDESFSDAISAMGITGTHKVSFIDEDGELYVIKHNGSYVD